MRVRRTSDELRAPRLDEFVEVASVDDLVDVLVLLAEGGRDAAGRDDRRLGA